MSSFTLQDVREQTYKPLDSWWTVLLVDPLASRLVKMIANRTSITPNQLTFGALLLGIASAACFAMADWRWLLLGAVLFHFSFVLDCLDGKIARLKGTGSVFGSWLDYVFDRVRVLICAIALLGGQFAVTGNPIFIWFAFGIVFVDMFRYLNSPQMAKVRRTMRRRLLKGLEPARLVFDREELKLLVGNRWASLVDLDLKKQAEQEEREEREKQEALEASEETEEPVESDVDAADTEKTQTAPPVGLSAEFPLYGRFRAMLVRNRIRPHLFSGIEFQMGVFIIAPLVGIFSITGMLAVIAISGFAMMSFELFLIYRLWLSTRRFERVMRKLNEASMQAHHSEESAAVSAISGQH